MQNRTIFQKFLIALNTLLVLVILSIGVDILVMQNRRSDLQVTTTTEEKIKELEAQVAQPTPTPIIDPINRIKALPPSHIEIPSIGVNTAVVEVGVTKNTDGSQTIEVPKNASEVGWYTYSPRPGETGGAILTAHYDTTSGRPAVFYNLRKLTPGDIIYIKMTDSEELLFQVNDVTSQPFDDQGLKSLVLGSFPGKELILITCDGVWDPVARNYGKRLVVFATLWENKTL